MTLIPSPPNSHAMLRVICRTADLLVLYAIHAWPLKYRLVFEQLHSVNDIYMVSDASTHGSDQDDTPFVPETPHLLAGCLRSEQDAVHVNAHDL